VGETCSGVVEFSSVDELLDCRRVFLLYSDLCAEIYSYGKKYYLWYEFYATADRSAQLTFALLEYGVSSPYDRTFLSEHGTLLPRALPLFL
jgi:negative regulator of genetic competence, sporulation and motility